jgi:mannose-6-phosphate isomerase-like protein (cupin superfamily)
MLNEQAFVLQAGDSLLFDAHLEHRFQNTSSEVTEMIIILTISQDSKEYVNGHFPNGSG